MKVIPTIFAFFTLLCAPLTSAAETLWPAPGHPPRIMNTISTLQFYGPSPGFHHGLDIALPAGAEIVAPVSGSVETGYYYKRKSDYTYEIAITTAEGLRWELHHIDPDDVPPAIERLAAEGGQVAAGTPVGRIYDAAEIGVEPHLHINLLSPENRYLNPLNALPPIDDRSAPIVTGKWWARPKGDRHVEVAKPAEGLARMIVEAHDVAAGEFQRQSIYRMVVRLNDVVVSEFRFDALPYRSFLEGAGEIYFLSELQTRDGAVLRSDPVKERRFLYVVDVDLPSGPFELELVVGDQAGNESRQVVAGATSAP